MTTTRRTITQAELAAQQIPFFAPIDMKGKWHAKQLITDTADCGAPVLVGMDAIYATKGDIAAKNLHLLICRRCARLNGLGYTSTRIVK